MVLPDAPKEALFSGAREPWSTSWLSPPRKLSASDSVLAWYFGPTALHRRPDEWDLEWESGDS